MYLGSWKIDDYLTFPANTHNQSTGAATDNDTAPPTYRIYEDENTRNSHTERLFCNVYARVFIFSQYCLQWTLYVM